MLKFITTFNKCPILVRNIIISTIDLNLMWAQTFSELNLVVSHYLFIQISFLFLNTSSNIKKMY